jgi:RNA 2',3'-cyclic 3'-phosphodiesterase
MRLFVAVNAPPVSSGGFAFRAAPPHLTIRFLGEVADERVDEIVPALSRVATASEPFDIELRGVGVFPDVRRPRVVWIGVGAGREELSRLEKDVSDALVPLGFPREARPYSPHLTLFRIRNAADAQRAHRTLEDLKDGSFGSVRVTHLDLKQSFLTREGAEHRSVAELSLGSSG